MRTSLVAVMEDPQLGNSICGFTQSHEAVFLIPPTKVSANGARAPHPMNGRVSKFCTMTPAKFTALFNHYVREACEARGVRRGLDMLFSFDCRVASFSTVEEALSIICWRCSIGMGRAISSAVECQEGTLLDGEGRRNVCAGRPSAKLAWLREHGLLPLDSHEAYGAFFARIDKSGPTQIPGNLLRTVGGIHAYYNHKKKEFVRGKP